ncbi:MULTISPECIES: hypothetical protein [unclassified Gilliamella]|nr:MULTISPECIES: hypothetical protein [unclassified Gilliamella]
MPETTSGVFILINHNIADTAIKSPIVIACIFKKDWYNWQLF